MGLETGLHGQAKFCLRWGSDRSGCPPRSGSAETGIVNINNEMLFIFITLWF
jgi:hypothetical protein